jgi:hypothetical protein
MERWFEEAQLHVIELPISWQGERPRYSGFIRELPMIQAEGGSRKEVYRQLAEAYQIYWENHQPEEEMTSSLLSLDELLKYYDGETFDGFEIMTED